MKTFTYTDHNDYYGSYRIITYYECAEDVHFTDSDGNVVVNWEKLYDLQDLGLLQIVAEEVYSFEGVWNPQTATRIR